MADPAETPATELGRALAMTEEEERDLLRAILNGGWDQGCFILEATAGDLITDPELWLQRMDQRARLADITDPDPHPNGLAHADPPADTGFVIVTQRCDLIRDLQREPLVELAPCRKVKGGELDEAGKNSPRYVLVNRPPGKSGWIIDLRRRVWLPKTRLPELGKPLQALPDNPTERAQFALRVGRRYSRKPLPARYVENLQIPLRKLIDAMYSQQTTSFTDWLIFEPSDRKVMPILIALVDDDIDMVTAEDTFYAILEKLDEKAREHVDLDRSRVRRRNEVPLGEFLDSYPIDLYEITYAAGKKRKKGLAEGRGASTREHRNPSM